MIEAYVNDIKNSLKNKSYFSALALALTLPDVCGMAESPDVDTVAQRYIEWYDKYISPEFDPSNGPNSENPWLSGEVVYNLRNKFLHQGIADIDSSKVKNENNKLDKFKLILGDATIIHEVSSYINVGEGDCIIRSFVIDVTYLCDILCDNALAYYRSNKEKFDFGFEYITQEELLSGDIPKGNPIVDSINEKYKKMGKNVHVE